MSVTAPVGRAEHKEKNCSVAGRISIIMLTSNIMRKVSVMENVLSRKLNIIEILLIISPIVDILTSVSERMLGTNLSIGLIVRALFL